MNIRVTTRLVRPKVSAGIVDPISVVTVPTHVIMNERKGTSMKRNKARFSLRTFWVTDMVSSFSHTGVVMFLWLFLSSGLVNDHFCSVGPLWSAPARLLMK